MNHTRTWKDHNKAEKQSEQKPLGAMFALLAFTLVIMGRIAHLY